MWFYWWVSLGLSCIKCEIDGCDTATVSSNPKKVDCRPGQTLCVVVRIEEPKPTGWYFNGYFYQLLTLWPSEMVFQDHQRFRLWEVALIRLVKISFLLPRSVGPISIAAGTDAIRTMGNPMKDFGKIFRWVTPMKRNQRRHLKRKEPPLEWRIQPQPLPQPLPPPLAPPLPRNPLLQPQHPLLQPQHLLLPLGYPKSPPWYLL